MNHPLALFAPIHGGAHIHGSVDCLIALAAGDIDDCNRAGQDQVAVVEQAFDGIVELLREHPAFVDYTYDDCDEFVYYLVMETWGHGVGLNDDPNRWGAEAITAGRDKDGPIYRAAQRLVRWIENNMSEYPSTYTLRVTAVISVVTEDSFEDGEAAGHFEIPATAREIMDWLSWIEGQSLVPNEDRGEDEPAIDEDRSENYTPLELVRLLDELGAEFTGSGWADSADDQRLLAENGYRHLPSIQLADGSWVEVVSATLDLRIEVIKANGDDPDVTVEELELARDAYHNRWSAEQERVRNIAAETAKEST